MNSAMAIIRDLMPIITLLGAGAATYVLCWALVKRPPKDSYEAAWLAIGFLALVWVLR